MWSEPCDISQNDVLEEGKNFDVLRSGQQKQGANPRSLTSLMVRKVNET